jgi:type II secretory pathway pseudopilin PulG
MPAAVLAEFWHEFLEKSGASIAVLVVSTLASFTLGRWWGRYRARRQWQAKEFLGRLIVSLNSFKDDKLKIRTIFERSLEEVFLNPHAVEQVLTAAQRTTRDNPILPIAKEDRWFLLNFVLNAVAERFSAGAVRQDAGEPVRAVAYALCLTSEADDELRVRKVRAMLIRQDVLKHFPYMETMPQLENPWHDVRVQTLRRLAMAYQKEPENFLTMELCV